jgi:hypothetical protein
MIGVAATTQDRAPPPLLTRSPPAIPSAAAPSVEDRTCWERLVEIDDRREPEATRDIPSRKLNNAPRPCAMVAVMNRLTSSALKWRSGRSAFRRREPTAAGQPAARSARRSPARQPAPPRRKGRRDEQEDGESEDLEGKRRGPRQTMTTMPAPAQRWAAHWDEPELLIEQAEPRTMVPPPSWSRHRKPRRVRRSVDDLKEPEKRDGADHGTDGDGRQAPPSRDRSWMRRTAIRSADMTASGTDACSAVAYAERRTDRNQRPRLARAHRPAAEARRGSGRRPTIWNSADVKEKGDRYDGGPAEPAGRWSPVSARRRPGERGGCGAGEGQGGEHT